MRSDLKLAIREVFSLLNRLKSLQKRTAAGRPGDDPRDPKACDSLDDMEKPLRLPIALVAVCAMCATAMLWVGPETAADKFPLRHLVADLPECSDTTSRDGRAYAVLDPVSPGDCSVGLGTDPPHLCICNGATPGYIAIPGEPVPFPATRVVVGAQSIPSAVPTLIIWAASTVDDADWFDIGDPTKLTFDVAGRAMCFISVGAPALPPQNSEMRIRGVFNGVPGGSGGAFGISDGEGDSANFIDLLVFGPGDTLEVELTQSIGSDVDIGANLICQRVL